MTALLKIHQNKAKCSREPLVSALCLSQQGSLLHPELETHPYPKSKRLRVLLKRNPKGIWSLYFTPQIISLSSCSSAAQTSGAEPLPVQEKHFLNCFFSQQSNLQWLDQCPAGWLLSLRWANPAAPNKCQPVPSGTTLGELKPFREIWETPLGAIPGEATSPSHIFLLFHAVNPCRLDNRSKLWDLV